jgi:hypothetical protein
MVGVWNTNQRKEMYRFQSETLKKITWRLKRKLEDNIKMDLGGKR